MHDIIARYAIEAVGEAEMVRGRHQADAIGRQPMNKPIQAPGVNETTTQTVW